MAGGNGQGSGISQLNYPFRLFLGNNQLLYILDEVNRRVIKWNLGSTVGQIVAGGNGKGSRNDQLGDPYGIVVDRGRDSLFIADYGNRRIVQWSLQGARSGKTIISGVHSTGLSMDEQGFLYVSDWFRNEVRRWRVGESQGTLVAGGNGKGNRLNQLSGPRQIFVDQNHSVYVPEFGNQRVMKWVKGATEGIVVAGGQGLGSSLSQLNNPEAVIVDQLGTLYIADRYNHRIVRWRKGDNSRRSSGWWKRCRLPIGPTQLANRFAFRSTRKSVCRRTPEIIVFNVLTFSRQTFTLSTLQRDKISSFLSPNSKINITQSY